MSAVICTHEDELLEALARGYVPAELEAHAATCQSCRELRTVAGALLDDRATAMVEAAVPAAGTMWWRMQVRRRHEAAAAARRSLLIGQAITVAVALALVAAFFGTTLRFSVQDLYATVRSSTPLLLVFATWIVGAPIAGWVATRQK